MMTVQRLAALRQAMRVEGIDCYLISSTDPHHNEYVPLCWQWRAWISGFKGSNGHVCITQDQALLWTDSRYFLEAEQAIAGSSFQLMKIGVPHHPSLEDWLKQQLHHNDCIGFDAEQWSLDAFERLQQAVVDLQVSWKALRENLLLPLWVDRPSIPVTPVILLNDSLTGLALDAKLKNCRQQMSALKVQYHVLSHLDAIAWLLNIRAEDIPYNPLCISYLIVGQESAEWFVQAGAITTNQKDFFLQRGVVIRPYAEFGIALQCLNETVWVDPKKTSVFVANQLGSSRVLKRASPIDLSKACKNPVEQEGMRHAHREDGLALLKFIEWVKKNGVGQRETEIAERLEQFRAQSLEYRGPSFQTISGFGPNGAIVHYSANPHNDAHIQNDNLYLVDSGGQYPFGTTDITRVFHFGKPTAGMKEHYTRVLKGHVALAKIVFPQGTAGSALDVLARAALWEAGLDFGHGTGHGVGCYLCVHEGPQGISARNHEPLKEGMILSNEPGYYWADHYGIRIENLMMVVPHAQFQGFLCFETITLCPYERDLITLDLLSLAEREWIDRYHERILQILSPHIQDKNLLTCLSRLTAPLMA